MTTIRPEPFGFAQDAPVEGRTTPANKCGYTIVELLVVTAIIGGVMLILSYILLNSFASYNETQYRLRLQRDMRTLTYWIRKDLTAMAERGANFDMVDSGCDFAFVAADNPNDTVDVDQNASDDGLDVISYECIGNTIKRTADPLGTLAKFERVIALECIDLGRGDTFSIAVTAYDDNDSALKREHFDATLGNFEIDTPVRRVEIELIFCKKPWGSMMKKRPILAERSRISSVALYQKGG